MRVLSSKTKHRTQRNIFGACSLALALGLGAPALAGTSSTTGTSGSGSTTNEVTCFNDSQGLGVICTVSTSKTGNATTTQPLAETSSSSDARTTQESTWSSSVEGLLMNWLGGEVR